MLNFVSPACSIVFEGVTGEDEGENAGGLVDLRLIVTLLEVGSVACLSFAGRVGVCGGCNIRSISCMPSEGTESSREAEVARAASTDLLREPPLETRCRFLAEGS